MFCKKVSLSTPEPKNIIGPLGDPDHFNLRFV